MAHIFRVDYWKVENQTWDDYTEMRNQAFNIIGCLAMNELSLQNESDKYNEALKELEMVKARGGKAHAEELLRKFSKKKAPSV